MYISQSLGADQTGDRIRLFTARYGFLFRPGLGPFDRASPDVQRQAGLANSVARGFILVFAVLLTGSRSVLLCVLMVALLFILIRRERTRLRLILLGVAGILAVSFVSSWDFTSQDGLIGYVSSRFLVASTEDSSLLSRASEIEAVVEAIRESPILGQGPFFSYSFLDPIVGWKDTTFVDSGLGYLLMKSGLMGTCMFIWFAVDLLKMVRALRTAFPSLIEVVFGSFMFYLVFLPFGPSFFVFQHSWFIGLLVGQSILLGSKFTLSRRHGIQGALGQSEVLV